MAIESEEDRHHLFESITARACHELFAKYGVALRRIAQEDQPLSPEFLLCAVIGFSGRHVRGTLVLATTEDLLISSRPRGKRVATRDWVGELSNQLLGHVKLELLRHEVEIYLNLPAVLGGEHLAPLPRKAIKPIKFVADTGAAAIWIEVEMGPGFKLSDAENKPAAPPAGETILFD
jgi:CheY-specific phosphatase CheX